jgi:hypothetical protein
VDKGDLAHLVEVIRSVCASKIQRAQKAIAHPAG